MTVDAEMRVPTALVRLVRFDLPRIGKYVTHCDNYRLDLCLTPRPEHARICYRDRWGPHRFERMGDVSLIPAGEIFSTRDEEGGHQASVLFEFAPETLHKWLEAVPEWTDRKLEAMLDIPGGYIRTLLARMGEEARHPRFASEVLVELMAGQLMIELSRFYSSIGDGPPTGGLAAWRLRLIDERLADLRLAPTLDELATLCNVSIRQLTRGFRASRGCSLGEFIEQRRIETAKRLLATGESVKTIAFALGFSSPSSFSYAFRRATGSTPRTFRQRQARMNR